MDSHLLDLPLGVKIPVKPKSKPVFCRGKLGEKLQVPSLSFNLDDPYLYHSSLEYNCLHDPHLQDYHKRKDVQRLLKRRGFITNDNKEGLLPLLAKLKDGPILPGSIVTSCQAERRLHRQKPSCPHPQRSKGTPLKSGRSRRGKTALDKGQTYSRAELGSAADSQGKPDNTADGFFKAVFDKLTVAEAQKLQEVVETVVQEVFGRLRIPRDHYANFLRRAARSIRGITFGGFVKAQPAETPLDHHEEMEMVAKQLLAMVLENLADFLESKASKPGRAARQKKQPVDRRATQADKSKEAETASSDRARLHACLDNLTRQVARNTRCLLKSMVASQFEGGSSCEYTKILELPKSKVSNRQMQQGFPGASKEQSQESSTGVELPALVPQVDAEQTGYANTMEPEDPATVKQSLVREGNPATSCNTLDMRTMANRIIQSLLDQSG